MRRAVLVAIGVFVVLGLLVSAIQFNASSSKPCWELNPNNPNWCPSPTPPPPTTTTTPPPTTTTTVPPTTTTTTPSPPECTGTQVVPGDSIQTAINNTPTGGTICFATGTHVMSGGVSTSTKALTLDFRAGSDPDAIIDGNNGGFIGFNGPQDDTRVTYFGGVFQHFGNAASPLYIQPLIVRPNDVVEGGEFKDNFNGGLTVQGSNAVVDVYTHHNGRYGITAEACGGCSAPVGIIIEDSEIAFNNTAHYNPGGDAGGTKFSGGTDGMIVRNNIVHDNYGSGLWWDGFNTNAQVYGNTIYGNHWWGIFYELSYGGTVVHDNVLTDNGWDTSISGDTWFNTVQILVSCSDGTIGAIEIYNNTVDGTAKALGIINHAVHPIDTKNVYFHNNMVILRSNGAKVGGNAFDGETWLWTSNNLFEDNDYRVLDLAAVHFRWNNTDLTWSQWQALGHDDTGSMTLL